MKPAIGPEAVHAFSRFIRARHSHVPVEIGPSAKVESVAAGQSPETSLHAGEPYAAPAFAPGALRGAPALPPPFVDDEGSRSAANADELRRPPHRFPGAKARARNRSHPGSSQLPVPRPLPATIKPAISALAMSASRLTQHRMKFALSTEQQAEKIVSLLDGRREMERSRTRPAMQRPRTSGRRSKTPR